jgi:AcrR family transcriptional regulator
MARAFQAFIWSAEAACTVLGTLSGSGPNKAMTSQHPPGSPRRAELLSACYGYVLEHGLAGLSLRPLAAATGTSPRVLLYLFGSKEQLVRELLARARQEQISLITGLLGPDVPDGGFEQLADRLWDLPSSPGQRPMVRLTYEAYLRSVSRDPGPWQGFAAETARDYLELLSGLSQALLRHRPRPRRPARSR